MKENKKHTKKSGFTTPDQYFENFEKQLLDSLETMGENKKTSLPRIKKPGFTVPDQYFENLESQVLNAVDSTKKKSRVVYLPVIKRLGYVASIAAMIVLVVTLWNPKEQTPLTFDSLAISDIQEYLNTENIELTLNDDELVGLLDTTEDMMDSFEDTPLSDQVLEDYLSAEDLENDIYIE